MRRKICVVTTSRADYGHLRQLMLEIDKDADLQLQVIATGMHLMPTQGYTLSEIEADGIAINRLVHMMLADDNDISIVKSIGLGMFGFADTLAELHPDIVVLLGDRFELFAPAIAALIQRFPIAHIHGGETSQGAIDEAIRHAVTKMAAYHFPAAEPYARRIHQMGEDPQRIFNCGAPGLDSLYSQSLLSKEELEERIGMDIDGPTAIITYHPVTTEADDTPRQVDKLLSAIDATDLQVLFTASNADHQGDLVNQLIDRFVREREPSRYRLQTSLGHQAFLSCLKHFDLMVGNSSAGLIEAPSMGIPVVNIGSRQDGRLRAGNVIDVGYEAEDIRVGIERALSADFRKRLSTVLNPYDEQGDGKASWRIKEVLKSVALGEQVSRKAFTDLEMSLP